MTFFGARSAEQSPTHYLADLTPRFGLVFFISSGLQFFTHLAEAINASREEM